ncbi:hypothetical protein AB8899_18200 [Yersinia enterocolitica]|uniref:hypothetical protein n=1 Tax=Yersinia enterocolitica TaxID=630 RepID=UPI0005E275C4|nr:hypothetical protein [Yersinia enterocolitica]EKN3889868.1 hypothetical protein [Yersinia enterocolitica]EKN3955525.1 hypothetical protein [Yersinia enterocolitica]EKN3997057.1 hypothetical protein [Yersinia enterocolitica]EKN4892778.1 hypothetical protein [Yersinia enterocolitica]EKN5064958.1 hypothetical protein [Yersinia enterocolitica]
MYISVNDLSFKGQFTSFSEIESCINTLFLAVKALQELAGSNPIRRTMSLADRRFTESDTIRAYMNGLYTSKKPAERQLLQKILFTFVQGPFIKEDELDNEIREITSICGESVDGTALHAYLSRKDESVHAVISAPASIYESIPEFILSARGNKTMLVLNFVSDTSCSHLLRRYETNLKHEIRADKTVNGEMYTRMDLGSEAAQQCLMNGIQIFGSQYVYGFMNEKWYEFRPHTDGCYHGFPIVDPGNDPILNRIKKVFGEPPYGFTGYQFCCAS